jgi:hypothetical protein
VYALYALFIPLAGGDKSVYGNFSNVWPDHGGSPINIMLILMSIFLFLGALVLH